MIVRPLIPLITVYSILEEFNARYEPPEYVEGADVDSLSLDDFQRIDDREQVRAAMILSALMNYGYEPYHYYYDRNNHELLLEYRHQGFVGALSLINVELSG